MKFQKIFALLLFFPIALVAQQFQGQAVYTAKLEIPFIITNPKITDETRRKLDAHMKAASEKTFILDFNQFESAYTEEQKLEIVTANNPSPIKIRSGHGKIYRNIREKLSYSEAEIFNKEFLIKDSLPQWNWELTNETKLIGAYQCNKAVVKIPVSEEDIAAYERELAIFKKAASQLLTPEEPKEQIITAWYTTEIPVSHGPHNYWGLPGLILEISDDKQTLLCSKITLNPEKKTKIKRPASGTVVTLAEFNKIENDKMESLKDGSGQIQINSQR